MDNASQVVFRLSPLQKTIWSIPSLRASIVSAQANVTGSLDLERLRTAFEQVAESHESLRTFFQVSPGFTFPFQVVREAPEFFWAVQDDASATAPAWSAFSPLTGPAFGVVIFRVSDQAHTVAVRALALCCDHVSLGLMLTEVAHLYAGDTVEGAVQYADFSEWHNEALTSSSEDSKAAKELWQELVPASLPHASKGSAAASAAHQTYEFSLPSGTQPYRADFLLACWQVTLWRLTRQESFDLEVLSAGRPLDELELSIGLFARPLRLRADFEANPSFASVLEQTTTALGKANRLQAFYPENTAGTVGFEFIQLPEAVTAGGIQLKVTALEPLRLPLALALACRPAAAETTCELVYDATRFEEEAIARIARAFGRIAQAATADPDGSAASFALLDEDERKQALEDARGEVIDFGPFQSFPQLFQAQAALTPERTALIFEGTALNYAELNLQSNGIASFLRTAGVTNSTPVGLCFERSAEMIIALLGILKAGGAYVPLLPDLPPARLAHQMIETRLKIVISMEPLLDHFKDFAGQVLCLDRDRASLEAASGTNPELTVTPEDLIYILYTSGSTGTPKGVEVRHGNVTNYLQGILHLLGQTPLSTADGLTFATVSTLGADLGNTSIFPPLTSGGCLAVIGYDAALDGDAFAQRNREHPVDVLKITPSNLEALLGGVSSLPSGDASILPRKFLVVGGEASTWKLAARVNAAGTCRMINHYGPTEATIGCLTYKVPAEASSAAPTTIVPLGKPLPNVDVYVLDRNLELVPAGVPGEICVSGAGIAAGYIGKPAETAEIFITHPFAGSGLLYRTGDLGRRLRDGSIEFLGRVDHQVKIRGYRVELTEIESNLNRHASIAQSVVLLSPRAGDDPGGDSLAAYVVASANISAADLQVFLRELLPDYMVPRDFIFLEQFPLNPNGKIDRRKLAELTGASVKVADELMAPGTELEERLITIWKEVLKREQIGVRDNFFELGGHSLLATQIISRVRSSLGLNVSIRMLFEAPTVESLAQAIETTRVSNSDDSEIADLLAELEGLSDSQAEEILGGASSSRSSVTPRRTE